MSNFEDDDGRFLTPDERWAELRVLQEHYPEFGPFLYDVVTGLMGFACTDVQFDIAAYLEHGPLYRMIQAQRGQAKTTITACYAVWRIIHNPSARILIVSSGDTMATEIANWVIQIIRGMPELRCLRPDKALGDRESVSAFDVHKHLKGPEKSPSIACMGITANMQGKRADILIADDVESAKNSATEVQRERLKHLTRDFTSICSTGDIIYLGTPQSIDSVYNGLASRGFDIRIWPGRYPTLQEEDHYGSFLAPMLKERMRKDPSLRTGGGPLGDRGKPTDPVLLGEEVLIKKEIDQGKAYFQLQHMLDTRLMDRDRFPLKPSNIVFARVPPVRAPLEYNHVMAPEYRVYPPSDFPIEAPLYRASGYSQEFGQFAGTTMYIDPAGGGQNGDETAWAVTKFLAGKVYCVSIGGVPGGYDEAYTQVLIDIAKKWEVQSVEIEQNYGNGALAAILRPKLAAAFSGDAQCGIEEVWETGQKELRIIDVLEPVLDAGKLIMDEQVLVDDMRMLERYAVQDRPSYSLFYQLARITRDKGSLIHDDRLDALAGAVRRWTKALAQDETKAKIAAQQKAYAELMKNPLGNGRSIRGWNTQSHLVNALDKRKRIR